MSILKKMLNMLSSAGGVLKWAKDCNIFSDYSLCSSVPIEEIVASPSSVCTLSIIEARLTLPLSSVFQMITIQSIERIVASPSSAYSLTVA